MARGDQAPDQLNKAGFLPGFVWIAGRESDFIYIGVLPGFLM